ncbi:hypothetical protein K7I13_05695 [Brucepastera parasyntrophica]|uniref:hypothetical protein n=1 Tax=Brucepastera parasyntrophica TaxID=2880008 RepID=UPI00210C5273|nr:hypothetical protein [Brucepastera parasyntrophica]ULQ60761.1 hypothetical protein K7I13_05695 [Brucepastera parasyntrophica]
MAPQPGETNQWTINSEGKLSRAEGITCTFDKDFPVLYFSGSSDALKVFAGDTVSVTVVPGSVDLTGAVWHVWIDGETAAHAFNGGTNTLTFTAPDDAGQHTISVAASVNGNLYSGSFMLTVGMSVPGSYWTASNITGLSDWLNEQDAAGEPGPYTVTIVGMDVSDSSALASIYEQLTQHVNLDLSGCAGTTYGSATVAASYTQNLVSITLPETVTTVNWGLLTLVPVISPVWKKFICPG